VTSTVGLDHENAVRMPKRERGESVEYPDYRPKNRKSMRNGQDREIPKPHTHTEGGESSLFIIRELWGYRLCVRGQSAKQRVESVKAVFRQAHLVIGRVGRWVGRKKRHWRLTSRTNPPSSASATLSLFPLCLTRISYIRIKLTQGSEQGQPRGHEHPVRQLSWHMWTGSHRSSLI
jgi:hypothetical protein